MIKVGDWVKYKSTGEIARVRVVDNDKYINGVCIDDCIKLPIKFKGFEIVLEQVNDQMRWDTCRSPLGIGYIHFACVKVGDIYHVGLNPSKQRYEMRDFPTIEEAKDWLELQYATMIAKARGTE